VIPGVLDEQSSAAGLAIAAEGSTHGRRNSRTRLCIVAPSLGILGGQSVNARRLIARLAGDPDLEISFLPHDPPLPGPLRHLKRVKYLRTLATFALYVASLRRLRRQDVVHIFSASYWSFLLAPAPAVLVGRALGKRVILNYRSGEAADHLAHWRTAVPLLRRATVLVVPSGYLVDVFARFGLAATPISNFVNVDTIPYRERGPVRPLFLANRNFAAHYNVACVLRAFRLIQERWPDAELVLAGDGAERDALHALARNLDLRNTTFVGQVDPAKMSALYDRADVYLNAPNLDNMPNSVIEAFAAGLPVVTTGAGGIPYIVTHDVNGLISPCDDAEALAANALRLLEDEALARRLSVRGRQEVEAKYTWPAVHSAWRRAYGLAGRVRTTADVS
jgi:L-malate glycosyltransferase